MTNSQRLATVRARLLQWLTDHHPNSDESSSPIVSESILIRDGFYCGRRFNLQDHRAVWFLEEDELKIFAADGTLKCVLPSGEISASESNQQVTGADPSGDTALDTEIEPAAKSEPTGETSSADPAEVENESESADVIAIQIPQPSEQTEIRRAA